MTAAKDPSGKDKKRSARRKLEHAARVGVRRIARPKAEAPGAGGTGGEAAASDSPNAPGPTAKPSATPRSTPARPAQPAAPAPVVPLNLFGGNIIEPGKPIDKSRNAELLAPVAAEVAGCPKCRLCQTRTNTVFGEGDPAARLMFVGEGPGADEDASGRPFVGRAGQLLDKMIGAMKLRREDVFIANIVKCRPPDNRKPMPDEIFACEPYLIRQIEIIRPEVICALGATAACTLLDTQESLGRLRGKWYDWRGIRLIVTYHPAYLLRVPGDKPKAWQDLQKVMAQLGIPL